MEITMNTGKKSSKKWQQRTAKPIRRRKGRYWMNWSTLLAIPGHTHLSFFLIMDGGDFGKDHPLREIGWWGFPPGPSGIRKKTCDEEVLVSLQKIWVIFDYPCGKRLAPSLSWMMGSSPRADKAPHHFSSYH